MGEIQIKGVESLSEVERNEAMSILEKGRDKLKRSLMDDFILKLSVKEYSKDGKQGKRKKYSVIAEVSGAVRLSASSEDWDLKKVLHEVVIKLCTEAEHKYRVSEQKR